jgi:hypothetical protein
MKRWPLVTVTLLGVGAPEGSAELPKLVARPRPQSGIPVYPYSPSTVSPKPTILIVSLDRIDVGTPNVAPASTGPATYTTETKTVRNDTATRHHGKETCTKVETIIQTIRENKVVGQAASAAVFQMSDQAMRIDHCSVSRLAVVFYEDGTYVLSFRADQNPQAIDPQTKAILAATAALDTKIDAGQFQRNQFVLRVHGYTAFPVKESPQAGATKPAVVDLPIDPFWVKRGEPYFGNIEGTSDAVKRNYKLLNRVEAEFTYR